jgi:hypothetical protein
MRSVYDAIKNVQAVDPIAASSAQTSAAIDTQGYNSAVVVVTNGAATGSPTSYTVDAKVQHSDTSGGTYTDVSGAAITQITADNKIATIRLEGLGGASVKRFIKVVVTPALTGGTSPKALIAATVHLGRAFKEPVGNTQ